MQVSSQLMVAGATLAFGGLVLAGAPALNVSAFGFFLGGLVLVGGAARVVQVGPSSRGAIAAAVAALITGFSAFIVDRSMSAHVVGTALGGAYVMCAIGIAHGQKIAAWIALGIALALALVGVILFPVTDVGPVIAMVGVPIGAYFVGVLRA